LLGGAYTINIFLVNRLPDRWALIPDTIYVRYIVGIIFGHFRVRRLSEIYKKKSAREIAELAEANIQYRIGFNAHISRMLTVPLDTYKEQNSLHGEEHLQAALKEGRGVMLLQAHYGNFYGPTCLLGQRGYDVTVLGIAAIPAAVETLSLNVLKRFSAHRAISGQGGGKTAIRVIRRKGILCAYFDVVAPGKGNEIVKCPLGDSTIAIYDGPARLAIHSNVVVVPVISYFTKPFHSETHIEPAFPTVQGATEEETVQLTIKQWMDWFEPKLMATPEQWWSWPFITLPDMQKPGS
jgi:lauroyl/myristoyl acyltransferase